MSELSEKIGMAAGNIFKSVEKCFLRDFLCQCRILAQAKHKLIYFRKILGVYSIKVLHIFTSLSTNRLP